MHSPQRQSASPAFSCLDCLCPCSEKKPKEKKKKDKKDKKGKKKEKKKKKKKKAKEREPLRFESPRVSVGCNPSSPIVVKHGHCS